MYWLSAEWLSANWVPLVVALLLGFILGWLLTGLSPRRKNRVYEAQIADLETSTRKKDRDLADVRKESDRLKSSVSAGESSLADLRTKLSAAEADAQRLGEERAAFEGDVQARNIEVADLKMQLALLQDQFDKSQGAATGQINALRADFETRTQELDAERQRMADEMAAHLEDERKRMADEMTAAAEQARAELASAKQNAELAMQTASSKDVALNEAYGRIMNLQKMLEEREAQYAAVQSELGTLRIDVTSLKGIKAELEDRLQKTRGDVAGEMAVLTSTMVKMKDEQLMTANMRIAELMNELSAVKSGQAVG